MAETSRTVAPPAVRLHMELVPHRSAAWRELWRRLFAAIEADIAGDVLMQLRATERRICSAESADPTTTEGPDGAAC